MATALAYHAVVRALESRNEGSASQRFAESVRCALGGHLPHQRHVDAGLEYIRQQRGADTLESNIREQFTLDLNLITVATSCCVRPEIALKAFNEYNEGVSLGARTRFHDTPPEQLDRRMVAGRELVATSVDPEPCQHASYLGFELVLRRVLHNAQTRTRPQPVRMSEIARLLGLEHSILFEASLALESSAHLSIPDLAKALGCHHRTLGRRLRQDGLTPEMLRQTARLLHAVNSMHAGHRLADVAVSAGFSDQAHMARAFKVSCGMPPTFFKRLLAGGP